MRRGEDAARAVLEKCRDALKSCPKEKGSRIGGEGTSKRFREGWGNILGGKGGEGGEVGAVIRGGEREWGTEASCPPAGGRRDSM